MVEHFYVTLGDPNCIGFGDIMRKKQRETDRRRWKPYPDD